MDPIMITTAASAVSGAMGMQMTPYMDLLATNQPWNLIFFMAIPVILAESLTATEFLVLFSKNTMTNYGLLTKLWERCRFLLYWCMYLPDYKCISRYPVAEYRRFNRIKRISERSYLSRRYRTPGTWSNRKESIGKEKTVLSRHTSYRIFGSSSCCNDLWHTQFLIVLKNEIKKSLRTLYFFRKVISLNNFFSLSNK